MFYLFIYFFVVESSAEIKSEEEHFKEFMQQDYTGTIILKKLLNIDVPLFYAPVSKEHK